MKTRKPRRRTFPKVTDKDVRERYDESRSAIGIGEFLADSIEALYGYGIEGEKVDQVAAFKSQFESLPEEQREAADGYFKMEQCWDGAPLVGKRTLESYGTQAKPFPFSPGVYRRVKSLDKKEFCKWLLSVAKAQKTIPALVSVLEFRAEDLFKTFDIQEGEL